MAQQPSSARPPRRAMPKRTQYLLGGLSGMAGAAVLHPLDLVKNRVQISTGEPRGSVHALRTILAREGFLGLYSGLTAGLLRQAVYTTTRFAMYTWMLEAISSDSGPRPSFAARAALATTAGLCSSFVATPCDLCLVRMTCDGRLPLPQRRKYRHALDALVRVGREEGVATLWRGAAATTGRAVLVNAAQLVTYSR